MLRKFWNDESGLETVEYAVMGALIIVGAVAVVDGLGQAVYDKFTAIQQEIES